MPRSPMKNSSRLMDAWSTRRSMAARGPSFARSNFETRSSKRRRRASSASMARRVSSLMRPSYSWKPRAVAWSGRAARKPRMYSSATKSSSASGFKGGGLFALEGFWVADGEGDEEEAGEEDSEGEGADFDLERRDGFSEAVGEGDASCIGFTGPVGLRGGAG